MGYQAESGPWRGFYLTAAMELRNPRPPSDVPRQGAAGQLKTLPAEQLLDSLSVRLNGVKAGARQLAFGLTFTDTSEHYALTLENAVLHHYKDRKIAGAVAVALTRAVLVELVVGETTLDAAIAEKKISIAGDSAAFADFLALLDRFDFWFEIVLP